MKRRILTAAGVVIEKPLSAAEIETRQAAASVKETEQQRRASRTPEAAIDEDVIAPLYDAPRADEIRLLKAVALALLDGLNIERQARGAPSIAPAALRDAVKSKLAGMA